MLKATLRCLALLVLSSPATAGELPFAAAVSIASAKFALLADLDRDGDLADLDTVGGITRSQPPKPRFNPPERSIFPSIGPGQEA